MKKLLLSAVTLLTMTALFAQVNPRSTTVHGYVKKNGTVVQPYHKTVPNTTKKDNYDHKGNTNPYTGKKGTKN